MRRIIIAIIFLTTYSYGQEKVLFLDSKEILNKVVEEKDNKKIVTLLDQINKNDSAYYSVLSSKTYYLLQLKKYDEVIKVAEIQEAN
jgi:hypothetical protein